MRLSSRHTRVIVPLLVSAALIAGCGGTVPRAPKPDTKGDAAFAAALKTLCASAPLLKPLASSQSKSTNLANARANDTSVLGVEGGIQKLTPSLSSASPLAPTITDAEAMLLDVSIRYQSALDAAERNQLGTLDWAAGVAQLRLTRAKADLAKLGARRCFGSDTA